jgi:hypothetical protein
LTKGTYRRAGLEGKGSKRSPRDKKWGIYMSAKYTKRVDVVYDLRKESMSQGHAMYERLLWSLQNGLDGVKTWQVQAGENNNGIFIELDSAGREILAGIDGISKKSCTFAHNETNTKIPNLDLGKSPSERQETLNCLQEWYALVALHADRLNANDEVDPFVSMYDCNSEKEVLIHHVEWSGSIPSSFIVRLHSYLQEVISQLNRDQLWAAIIVHGAKKSPGVQLKESMAQSKNGYMLSWLPFGQPEFDMVLWQFYGLGNMQ